MKDYVIAILLGIAFFFYFRPTVLDMWRSSKIIKKFRRDETLKEWEEIINDENE